MRSRLIGLAAFLGIVLLLVGTPLALLAVAGNPLPSEVPSTGQAWDALTGRDDGSLFLTALTWVAWIAWALFAVTVVAEVVARVRGIQAPSLGPQQRAVTALVGTAALLFVGTPVATAAGPPGPPVVAEAPAAGEPAPALDPGEQSHVVQPGDTLWGIAEERFGAGTDYPAIFEANTDGVQDDGSRLSDPDLIRPGWTLDIPEDPTPDSVGSATIQSASTPADPQPAPEPAPVQPDPEPVQDAAPAPPPPAATPAPTTAAPTTAAPTTAAAPAAAAPVEQSAPAAPAEAEAGEEDSAIPLRTAAGIGAILAAGLLALLAVRRHRQRQSRKAGQSLPEPLPGAAAAEAELAAVADPDSVQLLDRVLRSLADHCRRTGRPLPKLRFLRVTDTVVEAYLAEPTDLPAPWQAGGDPSMWSLDRSRTDGLLDPATADQVPAPYPALVTVGQDGEGGHVLLDLEHIGSLGVVGRDPEGVREVLTAVGLELATSVLADDISICAVGLLADLESAADVGRVRWYPTVDRLLGDLAADAAQQRALLGGQGTTLRQARVAADSAGAWTPQILLLADPLPDEQRLQLAELIGPEPRVAMAAVTGGDALGQWCLDLDEGPVLEPVGLVVDPQRAPAGAYRDIAELAAAANAPAMPTAEQAAAGPEPTLADLPAEPDRSTEIDLRDPAPPLAGEDAPAEPEGGQPEQPSATAPLIRLLGPVEVAGAGGLLASGDEKKRGTLTEMAAFLALHRTADADQLAHAISPARPMSASTRNTNVSKLRKWLGADGSGQPWLPRNGYRLRPEVRTDFDLFTELVGDSPSAASSDDLTAALSLVRGAPFANRRALGGRHPRYGWAEVEEMRMRQRVADAAAVLTQRLLDQSRWRDAAESAARGRLAEPASEQLLRLLLVARHRAGDAEQVQQLIDSLRDEDLEEETEELIEQISASV